MRSNFIVLISAFGIGLASPVVAQTAPPKPTPAPGTSPGDVPRTVFIATMDREFRSRDADGNGVISRAELERFEANAALGTARVQNQQLFRQLDTDRNGVISPAEFAALVGAPTLPDVSPQMLRLDPNRDQQVTLIEYRAATLANFDRLDTDLDGIVTEAELKAGNMKPTGPTGR